MDGIEKKRILDRIRAFDSPEWRKIINKNFQKIADEVDKRCFNEVIKEMKEKSIRQQSTLNPEDNPQSDIDLQDNP